MTRKIIAAAAALIWTLAPPAMAQIPVTDGANLAQSIQQALTTIQQLQQQYNDFEQQIEQYEQQIEQYRASTGNYGLGDLYGDHAERYTPGSWEETLDILRQGGSPGDAEDVARYGREYQEQYQFERGEDVYAGENQGQAAYTQEQRARNAVAALSVSKEAYRRTGQRLDRMDDYLQEIEQATDLKAALDLNNRLNVELTQALLEMNQLQAAQMQLQGADSSARTQAVQRIKEVMTYEHP